MLRIYGLGLTNWCDRTPSKYFLHKPPSVIKLLPICNAGEPAIPNYRVELLLGLLLNVWEEYHCKCEH